MTLTLYDVYNLESNPLRKGIIKGLLEEAYIMQTMPFATIEDLSIQGVRWLTLPDVGFRKINGSFTTSYGTTERFEESIYILGGEIDIDVVLRKKKNYIQHPKALQMEMKLKSIAYKFNDYFINGDQAVDPDGFDGLKVRVSNLPASQTITCTADLSTTGLGTAGNIDKFLDELDAAFYALDGHSADVLIMNSTLFLKFQSLLRRSNYMDTTKDRFGRTILTYRGAAVVDIGVKADQTTKIISDNHDATNRTAIYLVKFGVDKYLSGIQMESLRVTELGELPDKPVERTRIEWPVGLALWHKRGLAKLANIQIA